MRRWLATEREGWPLGYLWEFGGEEEASAEANQPIGEQVTIVALIVLLLLILKFNSVRRTDLRPATR